MAVALAAPVAAQLSASAAVIQQIELPAGPLATTLVDLADIFQVSIFASDDLVTGLSAPAVSGSFSVEQALDRALEGSGLSAQPGATGGFVIVVEPETIPRRTEREAPNDVVVVIGTKQNLSVQDTTTSVEIFDSERLEAEALFTLNDVLSRTPNISIVGNNIDDISIRGINRNGTGGVGQGQAINVFVDGAPISGPGLEGINAIWDTERVEVLRGSQSTVQGRNAIGGAIIVQSKKPTFDWETAVRLRIADFGTRQYSGVVSGPIIDDQLAFRISADFQETDGSIIDGFTGDDDNFQDNVTLRGRLLLEPDFLDSLSALFTVEYSDREVGRVQPRVFSPNPILNIEEIAVDRDLFTNFDQANRVTFPLTPELRNNETFKVLADITYDFSDEVSLKLLGTYEDTTSAVADLRREGSQFGDVGLFSDGSNVTYTAEARFEFDFERLSGLVGGYYFNFENADNTTAANLIGAALPFPVRPSDSLIVGDQITTQEVENFAFFTSWRFEPNDKWDIDFGLRYDNERFFTFNDIGDFEVVPDDCEGDIPGFFVGLPAVPTITISCSFGTSIFIPEEQPLISNRFDVFLPNGAVTYNFNDDFSVFAGVRRGYRAGGVLLVGSLESAGVFEPVQFGPEFLLSYEAGWRSQWFDKKLTVNGTAFFSDYSDQQIRFTDEFGFPNVVNAGETSIYGLELSANYKATLDWTIYSSLGLLETDIDEFIFEADDPDTTDVDETIDLAGNDLSRSPAVSFTIGTNYEHESGFFGSISLNYQSPYESSLFNLGPEELLNGLTTRTQPTTLVNGRVGYDVGPFTITAFVTNLLDDNDPEVIVIGGPPALLEPGSIGPVSNFVLRQPRTFGVSIDANF
ncbi:MAG: TonB-dependent receptor [Pseudomonadota bacterium]